MQACSEESLGVLGVLSQDLKTALKILERPVRRGRGCAVSGRAAFQQGRLPGATSPKGPLVHARAIFGGVAPAPPVFRSSCPGRPARIANPLPDKAMRRTRLLRGGSDRVAPAGKACCGTAFSPQQSVTSVAPPGPQPVTPGRDQDDRAIARSQSATVSPLRISVCNWNNVRSQVCFAMSVHTLVASSAPQGNLLNPPEVEGADPAED